MVIYIIRNTINKKVYIGQTTQSVKNRLKKHMYDSTYPHRKNNTKFYNAIKKHGKHNFYIEELTTCSNMEELNIKEIEFIKQFDSIKNGYNTMTGGVIGTTVETRRKISIALKGRVLSEETKNKISQANKGHSRNIGHKHTEITKTKMSIFQKSRPPRTEEENIKMSLLLKGKRRREENPFYGKRHSKDAKLKMAIKRADRKPNHKFLPETIEHIKQMVESGKTHREVTAKYAISGGRISQLAKTYGWVKLKEH